jgi:hypothetical protein
VRLKFWRTAAGLFPARMAGLKALGVMSLTRRQRGSHRYSGWRFDVLFVRPIPKSAHLSTPTKHGLTYKRDDSRPWGRPSSLADAGEAPVDHNACPCKAQFCICPTLKLPRIPVLHQALRFIAQPPTCSYNKICSCCPQSTQYGCGLRCARRRL